MNHYVNNWESELEDVTHQNSTSRWLEAEPSIPVEGKVNVYRPMGDNELLFLLANNQLPSTQPYQAIIEGEEGRIYSNKYLSGKKKVDTNPTTVVEFTMPILLLEEIKAKQMKIEDGVMSMGLGNKAGGQLPLFNEYLANGEITYRIVNVKRGAR